MKNTNNQLDQKPLLGITLGDYNGVGPEIIAKALAKPEVRRQCRTVIFGSRSILEDLRRCIPGLPEFHAVPSWDALDASCSAIPVLDAGFSAEKRCPGKLDAAAGRCAAEWIAAGAKAALEGRIHALMTGPVSKEGMLMAGCPYPGHTPLLAALSGVQECHMSLFSDRMRIVHITAHLALSEAVRQVTRERVLSAIRAGVRVLRQLGMPDGRIAAAGLNPHAGENGAFGNEEAREIAPAVADACAEGIACSGPLSPDTVFQRMYNGEFDLVVAMYHDQGHIPFKLVVMDQGVHATLGLPFIRTSPDHGTAYDIAGKGIAREDSTCAAIALAVSWAQGRMKGEF